MSCGNCKSQNVEATQNDTHPGPIPKYYFEQTQAKDERTNLRLVRALVLVIILFFLSNVAWLCAWMSYDYSGEESTVEIEALDGVANYIGGAGTIRNGE